MNRRRPHQFKTLWATFWELAFFALKAFLVTLLVVGWALKLYGVL